MTIRYVFSNSVPYTAQLSTNVLGTSNLKITTGENLQTSDIGSKKWKQDMNQLFGKFIKTSLLMNHILSSNQTWKQMPKQEAIDERY